MFLGRHHFIKDSHSRSMALYQAIHFKEGRIIVGRSKTCTLQLFLHSIIQENTKNSSGTDRVKLKKPTVRISLTKKFNSINIRAFPINC